MARTELLAAARRHRDGWRHSRKTMFSLLSLIALTLQNTALVLLMKHSYRGDAQRYSTASVVTTAECLKLVCCAICVYQKEGLGSVKQAVVTIPKQVHLAVPSVLYIVQNNLLFRAVHNLPVGVYVIFSQTKILTSALFSYLILRTVLDKKRLFALALLVLGMILVQVPGDVSDSSQALFSDGPDTTVGILSILSASAISGFSGVFLERIYKSNQTDSSLWSKNMQLACISVPLALIGTAAKEFRSVRHSGFFAGFDGIVAAVCVLQAAGGMIVAVVMRHASTILKCFAVSASICLCTILSATQGELKVTPYTLGGILLVNIATILYTRESMKRVK